MVMIGELNFKAKFDGTALTRGLMSSRQQMAFARQEMENLKSPAQRYADSINNINKLIAKYPNLAANEIKYRQAATRTYLEQSEAVRKLTRDEQRRLDLLRPKAAEVDKAGGFTAVTGLGVKALVGGAAASMAGGAVRASADATKQEALLGVLTQSKIQGQLLNNELREMSKRGLKLTGLQESAKLLLTFGVEAKKVTPMLARLGDVAMGDTERMKGLALAFGQAIGATRLMAEERNQMIERGFDPLSALSKATGQSMTELKQLMSEGRFSVQMLEQSLIAATSAGGRFAGGMAESTKGLSGALTRMSTDLENLKIKFGDAIGPAAELLANSLSRSLSTIDPMIDGVGRLTAGFKAAAEWAGKIGAADGKTPDRSAAGARKPAIGASAAVAANPIMSMLSIVPDAGTAFTAKSRGYDESVGMGAADRLRKTLGRGIFSDENNQRIDDFMKSQAERLRAEEEKKLAPQREKEAVAKRMAERQQKETDRASAVNSLTNRVSDRMTVEAWNLENPTLKANSPEEVKALRSMNDQERTRLEILTLQSDLVEKMKDDQEAMRKIIARGNTMGQSSQLAFYRNQNDLADQKIKQEAFSKEGDAMRERNMTTGERFQQQWSNVSQLQSVGAIDANTAFRERMSLQTTLRQQDRQDRSLSLAPSAQAGTQEAYQLTTGIRNNAESRLLKEQQRNADIQKAALEAVKTAIEKLPDQFADRLQDVLPGNGG